MLNRSLDHFAGNCVARALYDNIAETPDELAFRKGDVLTVLEQNTSGLEGWWLCSLRGRQGICPANRLRLLARVYDTGGGQFSNYPASPTLNSSGSSGSSTSSTSSSSSESIKNSNQAKPGLLSAAVRAHQQKQQLPSDPFRTHKMMNRRIDVVDNGCYAALPANPRPLLQHQDSYEIPRPHGAGSYADYDVPRQHPNRVITRMSSLDDSSCEYDVPRPSSTSLRTEDTATTAEESYDVPARLNLKRFGSDRSSGVSLLSSGSSECSSTSRATFNSSDSLSLSSALGVACATSGRSSRSSNANELYDVPRNQNDTYDILPPTKDVVVASSDLYDVPKTLPSDPMLYDVPAARVQALQPQDTYNVPPPSPAAKPHPDWGSTQLPLTLDSALETLNRLDVEVSSALTHFFGVWRQGWANVQQTELQLRVLRLRASLQELVDFARGAIGNACHLKSGDDQVAIRLSRLLRPLQDANSIVQKTTYSWTNLLAFNARRKPNGGPDQLDQLVACCKNLGDDVRLVTTFIQTNAPLLFSSSWKSDDEEDDSSKYAGDDYDYVNLESKAKFDQDNEEVKRNLPQDMKNAFDVLVRQSESLPVLPVSDKFSDNDRNVVEFYGNQAETYVVYLSNAIDAFILTIEHNQPPKVFVAYSKFVILNAHKLLCIGDTVHRNIGNSKLKAYVLERSNKLCQGLQTCVHSTKRAGREFPSVAAVQGMLDSVLAVSKLAQDLKTCLVQPIAQSGFK